ncbi:MAG: response regulator [Nitrospirae bacterium]|nr:response regulator [Nitrospirota bacterium]MCL5977999.1 response regulator [Nitrospirota bacterium]
MENEEQVKILIVDDEPSVVKLISSLISRYGYAFETAGNGLEAIEKARAINPDAILIDVLMPEMDGIEATSILKKDPETMHIPIISFSQTGDNETKIRCLNAGANDFLSKPIDPTELIVRLKNIILLKRTEDIKVKNEILTKTIKAIENAKREWELTMDCISDIVMLINIKDTILRCNKILTTITGKPYGELVGMKWQDILKESGFTFKIKPPATIEYYHPGGKYFIYDIYYLKELENSAYAAVITLHDITERKHTEEMLENKNKEIEKAYTDLKAAQSQILQQEKMASIGQLAAGIAHEINNPVGFVMSNLNTLQKYTDRINEFVRIQSASLEDATKELGIEGEKFTGKIAEHKKSQKLDYVLGDSATLIKESLEGMERVKKIVQDLKSFSRVDEAERKTANINEGIESTVNIVWNELKYKATVKKEYGDIPPTKCNAGQLNQVFMNILVNAAHAIEKQGEITIKTRHEDNNIFVSISDTGHGIPADKIHRIFEPFFTTKEVGKGTGLGLSIAYDIVKKHNGDIMVESEVGRGTTFTVKIPVVEKG